MGAGVQQSYTNTNLELATKAVNKIGESIDCDITEMEGGGVAAMGVEVKDCQAADIKEFCVRIEERVIGEFARAGERLDLGKRTNVLVSMDQTTKVQLKRIRTILATLRRARSSSTASTAQEELRQARRWGPALQDSDLTWRS